LEKKISHLVKKVLHDPVNRRKAMTIYPSGITQLECHHQGFLILFYLYVFIFHL
jgi:hypothetical protein